MSTGREAEKHKIKVELCIILIKMYDSKCSLISWKAQCLYLRNKYRMSDSLLRKCGTLTKWTYLKTPIAQNKICSELSKASFFAPKLSIDKSGCLMLVVDHNLVILMQWVLFSIFGYLPLFSFLSTLQYYVYPLRQGTLLFVFVL